MKRLHIHVTFAASWALAVLASGRAQATDSVLPIPSGWRPCEYVFAAASGHLGFVLYPSDGDPFASGSRLLLYESGNTHSRDIDGKVFALAFSADGSRALVRSESAAGPRVTLVQADGTVLWTKADSRRFAFTPGGSYIYAWQPGSEWAPPGTDVEVFSLQGTSVRQFTVGTPIAGVIVSDTGTEAQVLTEHSFVQYSAVPTMHEVCSFPLPTEDGPGTELQALGTDRLIARARLGRFRVLRTLDCGSVYGFDPTALDAADPARSRADYASFRPYATSFPNRVLLFRGSYDALILNLDTGALTSKALDIAAPSGAKLMFQISDGRMAFWSSTEFRVRSIAIGP